MPHHDRPPFWTEAFALTGSATPQVLPRVIIFGLIATLYWVISWYMEDFRDIIGPHEVAGGILGLLLVLRTNAGYDRWWEGRKLWGGIVNQTRNLVIQSLTYGPKDAHWQEQVVRWTAVFPHTARRSLRQEPAAPEVARLLGPQAASLVAQAQHGPSFVCRVIAGLLDQAREQGMDALAFQQAEQQRALLIDHIGACERIQSTPLPKVYSIKVRRFIVLFMVTLPIALLTRGLDWYTPLITMLVAYPLLSIDLIGKELQYPFSPISLGHLPLDELCGKIENGLLQLLEEEKNYPNQLLTTQTQNKVETEPAQNQGKGKVPTPVQ